MKPITHDLISNALASSWSTAHTLGNWMYVTHEIDGIQSLLIWGDEPDLCDDMMVLWKIAFDHYCHGV